MAEGNYAIEGMTCASCAQTVEKAVSKVTGIEEASVNLATEKLHVRYDETQVDEQLLAKTVADAGYSLIGNQLQATFQIEGMTCASCAQTVEKAVNKLAGVQAATVNLATEKLTVHYDKEQLNTAAIEAAVTKAGYQAFTEKTVEMQSAKKDPIQSYGNDFGCLPFLPCHYFI